MIHNNFNWFILDRNSISNYFCEIDSKILNVYIKQKTLHKLISNHIKHNYPIKITQNFNNKINQGEIFIGGMYYKDLDKINKISIEIQFFYHSSNDSYIIDSRFLKQLSLVFADTLLHEIIHLCQYRRRNFKELSTYFNSSEKNSQAEEQNYLGCRDEIDAYGFNIACELTEKFKGNTKNITKYLDENQKNKKRKNNSWRMYLNAFDHNHNHKIIKMLKKKVISYLPNAMLGKPYKKKN